MGTFKLSEVFCALLCLVSVQQSVSVMVDCRGASLSWSACCMVNIDSEEADVEIIDAEDDHYQCEEGIHYSYMNFGQQQSYICVTYGCGGTFTVTPAGSPSSTWSSWGAWSSCSVNCGIGSQTRSRRCTSGQLSDCASSDSNDSRERRMCYQWNCGVTNPPASWNAWGYWSACSVTCGPGVQTRTRTCTTGVDKDCSTNTNNNRESMSCFKPACPWAPATTATPSQLSCGWAPPRIVNRILGGSPAQKCQFPWMAVLFHVKEGRSCGGSIIDDTHILMAAHCVKPESNMPVFPASDLRVYSGNSRMIYDPKTNSIRDAFMHYVAKVKVHESYSDNAQFHDIAIITLAKPITFDHCHQPVCLPTSQQSAVGLNGCTAMGWGRTANTKGAKDTDDLRYAGMMVHSPYKCTNMVEYSDIDTQLQLCVGGDGTGACNGDSGSPLVCPASNGRYYQYGVVAAGMDGRCGQIPTIFTSVSAHMPWIQANLK